MSKPRYPFDDLPEPGTTITVAPGVRWLRMPLPMALDHINLYMIEDDDGWWLIDTGMAVGDTEQYWEEIFRNELAGKPVKAVLCTHWHPDHLGMAGWLCDKWRVPLYMTLGEYFHGRAFSQMTADDLTWNSEDYYRGAGRSAEFYSEMKANFKGFGSVVTKVPTAYRRLEDGDSTVVGGNRWRVVIGRGHSPEHACLYCESLNVLISGDQVIPRITSNVSVSAGEPEGNPLKHWLASHQKFLEVLPADALVLPAHNTPFYGLHDRLRYLIEHHEGHLLALEQACADQASNAMELLPVLFKRELNESQIGMALGECIAHLNYLTIRGQLKRELDSEGIYRYKSVDETLSLRQRKSDHDHENLPMEV